VKMAIARKTTDRPNDLLLDMLLAPMTPESAGI